jgi:hypothetical protein
MPHRAGAGCSSSAGVAAAQPAGRPRATPFLILTAVLTFLAARTGGRGPGARRGAVLAPRGPRSYDTIDRSYRGDEREAAIGARWHGAAAGADRDAAPPPRDRVRTRMAGEAGRIVPGRRARHNNAALMRRTFPTGAGAQAIPAGGSVVTAVRRSARADRTVPHQQTSHAGIVPTGAEGSRPIANLPGAIGLMDAAVRPVWQGAQPPRSVLPAPARPVRRFSAT